MKLVDLATGPDWIVWIVFVIFAVFSIILLSGHGSWFISGYNTASKEEKEQLFVTNWNKRLMEKLQLMLLLQQNHFLKNEGIKL